MNERDRELVEAQTDFVIARQRHELTLVEVERARKAMQAAEDRFRIISARRAEETAD